VSRPIRQTGKFGEKKEREKPVEGAAVPLIFGRERGKKGPKKRKKGIRKGSYSGDSS